ncbi:hypothetical protein ABPG75_002609 [Micractinium tetrahymenae]
MKARAAILAALVVLAASQGSSARVLQQTMGFQMTSASTAGTTGTSSSTADTTAGTGAISTGTGAAAAGNGDPRQRAEAQVAQLGFAGSTAPRSTAIQVSSEVASGTRSAAAFGSGIAATIAGLPFASAFGTASATSFPASYGYGGHHAHKASNTGAFSSVVADITVSGGPACLLLTGACTALRV